MIWVDGRIVADEALKISVLDRTFEHGLGLFETFRTWNGRAALLQRHLERLIGSANELGIPLVASTLPDSDAVAELLRASDSGRDAMFRITLSGGRTDSGGSILWMRATPLPPPVRDSGAVIALGPWEVARDEPLARHKALNYWSKRRAFEQAQAFGYDEILSATVNGHCFWEGSRTNLFLVKHECLITPSLEGPVLPGVMRALVLKLAREHGWTVREEADVSRARLCDADEVFLTNSVRGIVPVGRAEGNGWPGLGPWTWKAPGPETIRLMSLTMDWLGLGGAPK